ncbi:tyrosine-type recombinase/integrase [Bradyrhizobium sp. INPA03-11B]|uniref:tyrosine-type recombinase/integrase n=1 Tax=Bradyrhizobium sp. INPA03-11B TaxID=418598 RepID=UPI00338F14B8
MQIPTETPEITAKNHLAVGPGEYPCGNNLYLVVTPSGGRRWAFRYQRNGIVKKMGFGSAKAAGLKLSEARDKAIDALRLLAKGTDPREQRDDEKRRQQGSRLFGEFAEEWRQTYETGLKHKAARNKLKRIVQVTCQPLHKLQLDQIETEHVTAVLRKVWHQREISRDARQRIKKILDAAIALNLRPKHNPADWDSRLKPIMPKQRKRGTVRGSHKAMDYHDLPAFMRKLSTNPDQSARALQVAILTLARTNEVQSMRWSQLDLEGGLWNLNTLDTKNERPKRTPLPRQALAYLREAHESRVSDEFVFPGRSLRQPISNMTMLKHLKQITGDKTLTVHGFRTTFRTWAQEETDFEEEIVEHCLHHITGDDAEKAYKRGEALKKRRVVMQAFADYATRPPKNNVNSIRAA